LFSINFTKTIIAHLVHEAIKEDWGAFLVNTEFSLWSVIVVFLDVFTFFGATPYSYHPEELVDIYKNDIVSSNSDTRWGNSDTLY